MAPSNHAAWIAGKGEAFQVKPAQLVKPGSGEVLIRNHAIAINPVDWKMQDLGIFVKDWPAIFGCDIAGEVTEVGDNVSNVSVHQQVIGHAIGLATGKPENCAFQEYTVLPAAAVCPLPDQISTTTGSVLPLAISTAAHGLFHPDYLGLPYPTTNPKKTGQIILVWGGASSVGSCAIQLAVAAGIDVVTTASANNFEYCKKLGARAVFDYKDASVVDNLKKELANGKLAGVYDAIGVQDSGAKCGAVLTHFGGGFIATSLQPAKDLPENVQTKPVFAPSIFLNKPEIGKAVWTDFLPEALKSGQLKPAPKARVVGNGLDKIQEAVDVSRKGVSASKVVITL